MRCKNKLIEERASKRTPNVAVTTVGFILGNMKKDLGLGDSIHTRDVTAVVVFVFSLTQSLPFLNLHI